MIVLLSHLEWNPVVFLCAIGIINNEFFNIATFLDLTFWLLSDQAVINRDLIALNLVVFVANRLIKDCSISKVPVNYPWSSLFFFSGILGNYWLPWLISIGDVHICGFAISSKKDILVSGWIAVWIDESNQVDTVI